VWSAIQTLDLLAGLEEERGGQTHDTEALGDREVTVDVHALDKRWAFVPLG